jgi:YggT family protein
MSIVLSLAAAAITVVPLVLIARVVSGWVPVLVDPSGRQSRVGRIDTALARVTEPLLAPVRRVIPPLRLGSVALDLSVPVVLLALGVLALLLPAA